MGFRGVAVYFGDNSINYKQVELSTFNLEMALGQSISILKVLGYFEDIIYSFEDAELTFEKALEIMTSEGYDRKYGLLGFVKVGGGGDDGERYPSKITKTSKHKKQRVVSLFNRDQAA